MLFISFLFQTLYWNLNSKCIFQFRCYVFNFANELKALLLVSVEKFMVVQFLYISTNAYFCHDRVKIVSRFLNHDDDEPHKLLLFY